MADLSPELTAILEEGMEITRRGRTVLFLFEDMVEINEHFQAVIDWYKERGNPMRRRFGQGCFLESGMVYFVGADTHFYKDMDGNDRTIHTRGVEREFDLRPFAAELVRETGLEARLRAKGLA